MTRWDSPFAALLDGDQTAPSGSTVAAAAAPASNVVVIGGVIDLALAAVPAPRGLIVRIVLLVASVLLNGIATGAYIGAELGPGPRDGLMTGVAARWGSIRIVRTGIELAVLFVGWLLGGSVGIGTVVYAIAIGPLAHIFIPRFSLDPALAATKSMPNRRTARERSDRGCTT